MAKATGTDLKKPATPEQYVMAIGELAAAVVQAKPSSALMQRWATSKKAKRRGIASVLKALEMELLPNPRLVREQNFWAKLGVAVAVDDLTVPDLPADFTEIAIIPTQLSNEQLFALCQKYFPSWKYYDDLDKITAQQVRPTGTYVVGYRGGVEPDSLHLGKSYDVAMKEELVFLNPKERIVAELRYAVPDGIYLNRHLDVRGVSILSSLASDGCAFYAGWDLSDREFYVNGYNRSGVSPDDGPRQAVFA